MGSKALPAAGAEDRDQEPGSWSAGVPGLGAPDLWVLRSRALGAPWGAAQASPSPEPWVGKGLRVSFLQVLNLEQVVEESVKLLMITYCNVTL